MKLGRRLELIPLFEPTPLTKAPGKNTMSAEGIRYIVSISRWTGTIPFVAILVRYIYRSINSQRSAVSVGSARHSLPQFPATWSFTGLKPDDAHLSRHAAELRIVVIPSSGAIRGLTLLVTLQARRSPSLVPMVREETESPPSLDHRTIRLRPARMDVARPTNQKCTGIHRQARGRWSKLIPLVICAHHKQTCSFYSIPHSTVPEAFRTV